MIVGDGDGHAVFVHRVVLGPLEWAFPTEILESLNQSDSAYRSQSLTH